MRRYFSSPIAKRTSAHGSDISLSHRFFILPLAQYHDILPPHYRQLRLDNTVIGMPPQGIIVISRLRRASSRRAARRASLMPTLFAHGHLLYLTRVLKAGRRGRPFSPQARRDADFIFACKALIACQFAFGEARAAKRYYADDSYFSTQYGMCQRLLVKSTASHIVYQQHQVACIWKSGRRLPLSLNALNFITTGQVLGHQHFYYWPLLVSIIFCANAIPRRLEISLPATSRLRVS